MVEAAALPSLHEAESWVGAELAALDGPRIGEVQGFYVDHLGGAPAWLIAKLGRWRGTRTVAVPLRCCAGAPFGVWAGLDGELMKTAPTVDPTRPLRREHELAICAHFGIGENAGRAAEVVRRAEGDVTATPARRLSDHARS
jgi:hypothetical protein